MHGGREREDSLVGLWIYVSREIRGPRSKADETGL